MFKKFLFFLVITIFSLFLAIFRKDEFVYFDIKDFIKDRRECFLSNNLCFHKYKTEVANDKNVITEKGRSKYDYLNDELYQRVDALVNYDSEKENYSKIMYKYEYNTNNNNNNNINESNSNIGNIFKPIYYDIIKESKSDKIISLFLEFFESVKLFLIILVSSSLNVAFSYGLMLISIFRIFFFWYIIVEPYMLWLFFKLKKLYKNFNQKTKKYVLYAIASFLVFLYFVYSGLLRWITNSLSKCFHFFLKKLIKINQFILRISPYFFSLLLYYILIKAVPGLWISCFLHFIFFPLPFLGSIFIFTKYIYFADLADLAEVNTYFSNEKYLPVDDNGGKDGLDRTGREIEREREKEEKTDTDRNKDKDKNNDTDKDKRDEEEKNEKGDKFEETETTVGKDGEREEPIDNSVFVLKENRSVKVKEEKTGEVKKTNEYKQCKIEIKNETKDEIKNEIKDEIKSEVEIGTMTTTTLSEPVKGQVKQRKGKNVISKKETTGVHMINEATRELNKSVLNSGVAIQKKRDTKNLKNNANSNKSRIDNDHIKGNGSGDIHTYKVLHVIKDSKGNRKSSYDVLFLLEYWLLVHILQFLNIIFRFQKYKKEAYMYEYCILLVIIIDIIEKLNNFFFRRHYKYSVVIRVLKKMVVNMVDLFLYFMFNVRIQKSQRKKKKKFRSNRKRSGRNIWQQKNSRKQKEDAEDAEDEDEEENEEMDDGNDEDNGDDEDGETSEYNHRRNILIGLTKTINENIKFGSTLRTTFAFMKSIVTETIVNSGRMPIYVKVFVNVLVNIPQLILLIFPSFILKLYFLYFYFIFPVFGSLKNIEKKSAHNDKVYFICYFFFFKIAFIIVNHSFFRFLPFYNLYKLLITISAQMILKYICTVLKSKG